MRRSISRILADRARTAPDDVIVVDTAGSLTAAQLDDAATRGAKALRAQAVRPDGLVTVALALESLLAWARTRLGSRAPAALRIVHTPVRDDAGKASRRRWAQPGVP